MDGQRVDPGAVDSVPVTVEVDDLFGPEPSEQLDLLLEASAAATELHAQRLEAGVLDADAESQPELSSGQDVELGGLLREQARLSLRGDHDAGGELQFESQRGGEREQGEGLVE